MRILFLGFYHRVNDPRLFHRQMRVLKSHCNEVELFFLTPFALYDLSSCFNQFAPLPNSARTTIPSRFRLKLAILKQIPKLRQLRPSVIQASDARELPWAFLFRLFTGAPVIYDSHEDYFNQIFEYSGRTLRSFVSALRVAIIEILLLRFSHTVFCTDEFLLTKYAKSIYGCRSVKLLRNFPSIKVVTSKSLYPEKNELDLVYVGGVNPYRGVAECANYVSHFNEKHGPIYRLTFTAYSPSHSIVDDLIRRNMIRHFSWMDYAELMQELPSYDVGICLWHRLKKFERNLPLKNFDYMAAGLPFITSDFGNLQKYARLSGGAICINPLDYDAFEEAIFKLFKPLVRRTLGEAGRSFVTNEASFEVEASQYVKIVTELL